MNKSQKARAKLYRTTLFRHELADRLGLGIPGHVNACLDTLLDARRLPSSGAENSRAVAMDAALIIVAVGSLQTNSAAVLNLTDQLCAMKLSKVTDTGSAVKQEVPIGIETDFVTDLSMLFEEYWAAPIGAYVQGLCHTVVLINVGDDHDGDRGTLQRISAKRRQDYSTTPAPNVDRDGAFPRTTRGGVTYMPAAIANLAELLRDDLDGSAAAIRA